MYYKSFDIENYKGIKKLNIDLEIKPNNQICTLVGLNESGKTTILEAIHDFEFTVPNNLQHTLIPKAEVAGFTGNIKIIATIQITKEDKEEITAIIKKKVKFFEININDELILTRTYGFTDSNPSVPSNRTYEHFVKIKKQKTSKIFTCLDKEILSDLWSLIQTKLLPEVIYYRDFLSKFPDKIYLEPGEDEKEKEYYGIIEDVLTSIDPKYTINTHILPRLNNISLPANKQSLTAVLNQMSHKVSQVVFDAWNKIQKVTKKEIIIEHDEDVDGRKYLRFSIKEGTSSYAVSERSLGFRWFFTFLLYTEFRKERIKRSGKILFLLDEPASNLHQTAQQSLLGTFNTIAEKSQLIYTTHSHHLIDPKLLNSTYIIRNKGLQYEIGEADSFFESMTEIEAQPYKQFVSNYPEQTSYFQPILDVLDYKPGMLEAVSSIVITEGKNDYFTFRYFTEIVLKKEVKFQYYPGHGAGKLDTPISLYESWGKPYLVLLDGDKAGKKEKDRYILEISSAEKIFTLGDINNVFDGLSLEKIFTDIELLSISQEYNPSLTEYNKGAFNTGLQILFGEKRIPAYLSKETKSKFENLIIFLESKF